MALTAGLLVLVTGCGGAAAKAAPGRRAEPPAAVEPPSAPAAPSAAPSAASSISPSASPTAAPAPALTAAAAAAAPSACEGPGRRRDFDFWLGAWEVRNPKGVVVGHNRLAALHGGCAMLESWSSARGGAGSSLNFYDPTRRRWRQIWVDGTAGVVDLEGELVGDAMVLEGTSLQPDGTTARIRGTWTPLPDGQVRQHFEQADGAGWKTTFDGRYSRQP